MSPMFWVLIAKTIIILLGATYGHKKDMIESN